jgi:long-chain acyl-CoA synthetase
MFTDFLLQVFKNNLDKNAIAWKGEVYTYEWLINQIDFWRENIKKHDIQKGSIIALEADFSPNSLALLLVLLDHSCVLVPLTKSVEVQKPEFISIAQGEFSIIFDEKDNTTINKLSNKADHEFYGQLREKGHPGLVLFSSGSTGKCKAAVHDFVDLLEKFKTPRHSLTTITFLLYDHIGGINTLLYVLSNAGFVVTVQDRKPDNVLGAIDKYKAELLPTTPTFINLILLSGAYKRHDLSSLKTMTYGTEPMPESTLKKIHEVLPEVRMLQTYGLSEVGILRSKSKSSNSLWVKVGGGEFQTRVVDRILQIKADSAMLGYLNAPSPFTEDGWFNTGDLVEVDGEYIKILGRQSEMIIVGGEKVYPAEVESVVNEMPNVADATVYGESNPITGNIVCVRVGLVQPEDPKKFSSELKQFCRKRLPNYKVPIKIKIQDSQLHNERFKKIRTFEDK